MNFFILFTMQVEKNNENIFINLSIIFLENSSLLAIQGPNSQESLNF